MNQDTIVSQYNGIDISAVKSMPQGKPRAVVLLVHGLGGQKNSETHLALIPKLAANDIASLRFDFPGHGESEGDTLDLTIGYGSAVVDHAYNLMCHAFPSVPMGLFGASFGATAILKSEAIKKASALVMRSPVSNYVEVRQRQLGADKMAQWQREGSIGGLISKGRKTPWSFYEEAKKLDFFKQASTEIIPTLIVQGTKDDTTPTKDAVRLFNAWKGVSELLHVEGGDHSLSNPLHTEFLVAVSSSWFSHHLL